MSLNTKITVGYEEFPHKCAKYPIPLDWLKANCRRFYYTEAEIMTAASSDSIPDYVGGIYFLVCNNKIVYVGQSKNISHRIGEHVDSGRKFNKVAWFEAPALFLTDIEMYYIERINPEWNVRRLPSIAFPKFLQLQLAAESV